MAGTGFLDAFQMWADAHAFFAEPLLGSEPAQTAARGGQLATKAARWRQRLVRETPNGDLLQRNVLFDALTGSSTLTLLHVTHALERIRQRGVLYPSGGCLVGSVYCCPLIPVAGGLRLHNLGAYVLTKEAPAFVARLGRRAGTPTPLIIEIAMPHDAFRGLAGIDYLRLGDIHLQIFLHLEYLLSRAERHRLRERLVARVKNATTFLELCAAVCYQDEQVTPETFLPLLDQAAARLPILGYLSFEAVAEYLMLHSRSPRTRQLKHLGELNNEPYKEVLFGAFPGMAGAFNLSDFRVSAPQFTGLLTTIDPTIDPDHARRYLVERISFLVSARLFPPTAPPDWHHLRWEFDTLCEYAAPLLGHLIHRELRTFGRYPDFYFYYDQYKALQAWNYWNHMDIVAPFNGTIPKGEVGINPAYPDLDYTIYLGEVAPATAADGGLLVRPVRQLDLTIVPRLVDLKYTLMRDSRGGAVPLDDE